MQRQLIVNGEVLARYGDELVAKLNSTTFTPTSVAEFQFGATPLNVRQSNLDAQRYTVSGGETLRSIARSFYGDDKLWYLIAQANGLSGSTQLSTGQTLSIPKLAASSNAADSFKPYDPSKVVGDLTPNLPMPQNDKGCGVLGQIIMIVVAIVVTIYTAGAMSGAAAQFGGGFMGTMQAGAGAMMSGSVAGSAVAAAAGSIASQLVGNAIGAVDGFSWKSVALSALSAGVSGGFGGVDFTGSGVLNSMGNVVVRAAIGNAVSQGIGVVTGLQRSFDWKGVAASAVGAGVGQAVGGELGKAWGGTPMGDFAARAVTGLVAGTAAAAMRGGRVAIQQVATDAFGNALGRAVADSMMPQNSAQESFRSSEISEQNAAEGESAQSAFRRGDIRYQNENTPADMGVGSGLRLGGGAGLRLSGSAVQAWSNAIDDGVAAKSGAGPLDEVVSNGSIRNALYRLGVDDAGLVKVHEVGGHFSDLQYVGQPYVGAYSPKLGRVFAQSDLNLMVAHSQFLDQLKDLDAKAAGVRYEFDSDNRDRLIQQGLHSLNDLGADANERRIIDLLRRNPGNLALAGAAAHPFVDAVPHENRDTVLGHTFESLTGRDPDPLTPAAAVKLGSKLVNYFEVVLGVSADTMIAGQSVSIRDQAMQNVRDAVKSARETGATGEAFDEQFGAAGRYILPQGSLRLPTLPDYGLGARYNSLPFEALATTEDYLQSIQLRVTKYKFLGDALDSAATIMNHYMDYTGRRSVPPVQANQLLGRTFNVDGKPVGRY